MKIANIFISAITRFLPSRSHWHRLAGLPVPLLAVAVIVLWAANLRTSYESPYILIGLNFLFSVLVSLFVIYLIGRSFLATGAPGLLMLGCGIIIWGAAGFLGATAGLLGESGEHFANFTVTIHNTSVWLSAVCQLTAVGLLLRKRRAVRAAGIWLAAAYAMALLLVGLITFSALAEWLPTFFVQGQGGTLLRQFVLGSAIAMFALMAVVLESANRRSPSPFSYWYGLSLGLIAVGLFGVMMEPTHGCLLSWTGRAAQFLGGAYMLVAAVASVREAHDWIIPLEETLHRQPVFVAEVLKTVGALVTVLDREGRIVSFNRACEEVSGYSLAEIKGKYIWDFLLLPDEIEPFKAVIAQLQAGQFPNAHENCWVNRDGARHLIHWHNSCLTDSRGAVEYVIATGIEVTDRRRAEEALRQAKDELERKVEERTAELQQTNEQLREENQVRVRTEHSLRLEEARLDALFQLSQMDTGSLEEITEFALEQAIKLTNSRIGFLGLLNEDESVYTLHAVSKDVVKDCKVTGDPLQWHVVDAGIWAEAIREHATLFINDYSKPDLRKKGLPDGHLAVERFMAVPIFEDRRIVAIAGVGNKASDYEKSDERQIVLLLTGMWGYVRRNRSREELRQAYNELEKKVKQRTAELAASTAALQESHKDLNRAQEVGQIGSWREDVRHNVLRWSDETHRIFGVPKGTPLTYEKFRKIVHPEDRRMVERRWKMALCGEPYDLEHRIVVGGKVKWVREKAYLEFDDEGKLQGGFGITQDITERKLAEEALRESEERHRLLAETMLQGVVHQSADGTIIAMNPAAERILGKTRAEFLGSSSVKEEHRTVREDGSPFPGMEHPAMVALRSGEPVHGVVMGLFHPGRNELRWIRIDAVPIFGRGEPLPVEVYTIFEDITDRKKAEEALKKSEKKYRTLFDSMSEGFILGKTIFDEKGKPVDHVFLEVNDAFEKLTGIKKAFILNKPVTKAIPGIEKDPAGWIGVYGKVAKTGKPVQFENYAQHERKWYSLYVYSPMKDHFAVMFSDITERKNHQERINNLNLLLDTITSSAKFIIATIDRNFRFTYFNKEHKENIKRITGKDNKIGMSIQELFSEMPDQQKIALELWERVLKGETVEKVVEFGPKHYRRYYRTRYVPILDTKGKVAGAGEVSNDITEIIKTEEALRQSEEKYRSIVETATEAILIVDPEARIVFVNDRWSEMLGYSREEAMQMTHFELVFPEDLPRMRERWKFRRGGRKESYEFRLRRKDGSPAWVLVGVAPRFGSAGEFLGTLTMLADITERKQAEEALHELNVTLESKVAQRTEELEHRARQLQKLTLELTEAEERERKRLAEILHDDLQQVLVAASFQAERLRMRVMDDAGSREAAGEVRDLLIDAIDKSRSLSHELSSPALSQGDLGGAFEWLARQMQQKHGFTVHLEIAGTIEVASEPRRFLLYKAAQEMLLNVIKHAGVREARLRLRRQHGRIWLTLSDRGRGFDLVHPGHTPGFGLLSIRERVESLGGRLKIKSAPDKGSTFIITVPDEKGSPLPRW